MNDLQMDASTMQRQVQQKQQEWSELKRKRLQDDDQVKTQHREKLRQELEAQRLRLVLNPSNAEATFF